MHLNFIKHSQTSCICLTFLQCGFLNASSNSNWSIKLFADQWECFPELGAFPWILTFVQTNMIVSPNLGNYRIGKAGQLLLTLSSWKVKRMHQTHTQSILTFVGGISQPLQRGYQSCVLSNSTNIIINLSTYCQAQQNYQQIVRWQCCQLKTI